MPLTPATVIGVDLGGTNLRAARVDRDGKILDAERVPTPPSGGGGRRRDRFAGPAPGRERGSLASG